MVASFKDTEEKILDGDGVDVSPHHRKTLFPQEVFHIGGGPASACCLDSSILRW
jgi:hypothetical protein